MNTFRLGGFLAGVLFAVSAVSLPQSATPPSAAPPATPKKGGAQSGRTGCGGTHEPGYYPAGAGQASGHLIVGKIKGSKTRFDTSVDGLIALREAGVSDRLIAVILDPASASAAPVISSAPTPDPARTRLTPAPQAQQPEMEAAKLKPGFTPSNAARDAAPTVTAAAKTVAPKPVDPGQAPQNYGVYIQEKAELKPIGRIQTKVQLSKVRTVVKNWVPFMREKIDINIPGAHSTSRHEVVRPNFLRILSAEPRRE